MHYLSYISKARAQLIEALRRDLASLEALSNETEAKLHELAQLQAEQAQQRAQLEQDKRARQAVLAKVSNSDRAAAARDQRITNVTKSA